jgi:hypothetical protein
MTDTVDLSIRLSTARKEIKQAHQHADNWPEDLEHTKRAIDAVGIQHISRAGEELPERIVEAQVRAMADLTFTYAEQAYHADDDELTFYDDSQREAFREHLDEGHDTAMGALRKVEGERDDTV